MLDEQLKKDWVAALRSGKYKQGEGALKRVFEPGVQPEYCCLGVLAECLAASGKAEVVFGEPVSRGLSQSLQRLVPVAVNGEERREDRTGFLPLTVLPGDVQGTLAAMNDTDDDFEEIADYIEKNL